MEKNVIVIGLIFILIFVGLCGCQAGIPDNPDRVQVHDEYKRTVKYEYQGVSTQTRVILAPDSDNFTYHPNMEAYEIHGYIQHGADRTLAQIIMKADYYDDNSVLLATQEQYFYDAKSGVRQDFLFRFTNNSHFETVKKVTYTFNVLEQ